MDWFKHDTTSIDDPDIQEAEEIFGDAGYAVFFKILEIYGKEFSHLVGQKLRISSTILRRKLRKSSAKVEQMLNFYQTKNRIFFEIDGPYYLIEIPQFIDKASNWTKRQKPIKDTPPTEVPTEAPTAKEEEEEKEEEYIEEEEERKDLSPTEKKILQELKKVKNYPYKFNSTIDYIRELSVEFPDIDILEEVKKKCAWWKDHPLTKKSNPHLQLRNWFRLASKWETERKKEIRVGLSREPKKPFSRLIDKAALLIADKFWEQYEDQGPTPDLQDEITKKISSFHLLANRTFEDKNKIQAFKSLEQSPESLINFLEGRNHDHSRNH
jgi:hypothetical protein